MGSASRERVRIVSWLLCGREAHVTFSSAGFGGASAGEKGGEFDADPWIEESLLACWSNGLLRRLKGPCP